MKACARAGVRYRHRPSKLSPPPRPRLSTPVEVGPASAGPAAGSRCLDPHHDFEIGPWPPIICFAAAGAQGGRRWVLCRVSRRRLAYCSHGPYLYSLEVLECITAAGNGPVPWRWGLFATRRPSKVRQLDCSEEPALRDSEAQQGPRIVAQINGRRDLCTFWNSGCQHSL